MFARKLLTFILAAQLAAPATVWGEAARELRQPQPEDTARFFAKVAKLMKAGVGAKVNTFSTMERAEMRRRISEGIKGELKVDAKLVGGLAGHNTQTLLILWILGSLEAIHQQEHFRPITKNEKIRDPENFLQHINNWWDQVLNNGKSLINSLELTASLVGGGVMSTSLAPATAMLNQLIEGAVTRPFLAKLLTSGLGSFVTFVGWEAGHRIIQEAIWLLEEEDIKVAKDLKFYELMTGGGTPREREVFARLMGRVWEILKWAQPEVTHSWIYNTWRLNIATGEFVATITSMVVAGVVAGTFLPGPGWLVGGAGGLVGGVIAVFFVPASWKQAGTDGIRRGRMNIARGRMDVLNQEFRRLERALGALNPVAGPEYFTGQLERFLKQRSKYRDDFSTALVEQAYDGLLKFQEGEFVLNMIAAQHADVVRAMRKQEMLRAGDQPEEISVAQLRSEAEAKVDEGRARFTRYMNELLEVQRREADFAAAWAFAPEKTGHPFRPAFAKYFKEQQDIYVTLAQIYAGLMPAKITEFGLDKLPQAELEKLPIGATILINLLYMRGFDPEYLLEN